MIFNHDLSLTSGHRGMGLGIGLLICLDQLVMMLKVGAVLSGSNSFVSLFPYGLEREIGSPARLNADLAQGVKS